MRELSALVGFTVMLAALVIGLWPRRARQGETNAELGANPRKRTAADFLRDRAEVRSNLKAVRAPEAREWQMAEFAWLTPWGREDDSAILTLLGDHGRRFAFRIPGNQLAALSRAIELHRAAPTEGAAA